MIALGFCGLLSAGLYLWLPLVYPLRSSLENPRASWASMTKPGMLNIALHIGVYLGLTLLYLVVQRLLTSSPDNQAEGRTSQRIKIFLIVFFWLVCSGVLLAAAPAGESHDIFDYLFRGRMLTEYQTNPLAEVPKTLGLSAPYTRFLAWRKNVDTYGPVWEAASATVSGSVRAVIKPLDIWDKISLGCPGSDESCRGLIVYISGYRLLALILTGLSGWLVAAMVRRRRETLGPAALAAWLLNPMVLIGSALGGHNDAVLLFFVLLSWFLLQRQRFVLGLVTLVLAAHVKLTALIWLPACVLWVVWQRGWKQALKIGLLSALIGLGVSWLLYLPFEGWQTLPRMLEERSKYLANSAWYVLKDILVEQYSWPARNARIFLVNLSNGLFALGAVLIPLWKFNLRPKRWRTALIPPEESDRLLWRVLAAVSLFYLLMGAFWFQHWYVLWALAAAVLLPQSRCTRFVLPWLAFGALTANFLMSFVLDAVPKESRGTFIDILPVILTWGPPLMAACVLALARLWGGKSNRIPIY